MNDWAKKEEWHRRGQDFLVVVKHYTVDRVISEGVHRWNVYAYIYPGHPRFAKFDGPAMFQPAANALHLHRGPSFLKWHRDDNMQVTSVQVGSDYNHLHDGAFTLAETPEQAAQVFSDAEQLFDQLSAGVKS